MMPAVLKTREWGVRWYILEYADRPYECYSLVTPPVYEQVNLLLQTKKGLLERGILTVGGNNLIPELSTTVQEALLKSGFNDRKKSVVGISKTPQSQLSQKDKTSH